MNRLCVWAVAVMALAAANGCGSGGPAVQKTPAVQVAPLDRAKQMVKVYADGNPVTSEAADWPQLVEEVRQTDPAKADVLKKGLDEIKANPASSAAKAKDLLAKL